MGHDPPTESRITTGPPNGSPSSLRSSLEAEAITAAERAAGRLPEAREITVAFADVVGLTELGEKLQPDDLERLANRLATAARDAANPPVRFVKSIGDAVMLVSSQPTPLVTTMLDLVDSASANDLPSLRIGVASGSAVSRAGDWFGNPVNLASRVSAAARPGAVLVGLHAGDRRRRRPPVVVRRRISSEGRQQQGQPVSGAARPGRPSKAPV